DLANPRGAYLWDAARRQGLWVVNFGEGTVSELEAPDAGTNIRTNFPGLKQITASNYPGFVLDIPDTTRARLFADSVGSWDGQGRFPDLVILWLPRDHTRGRRAGEPTPRAMVADNDLALGRIVERLSHSRAWPSLAVFALRRRGVCPSAEHLAAGRTQPQRVPLAHSGPRSRSGGRGGRGRAESRDLGERAPGLGGASRAALAGGAAVSSQNL